MNKFALLIDILIAIFFYGILSTVGGFLALLFWSGLGMEMILKLSAVIGISATILGTAIPLTRNLAVSIVGFFAPLGW